MAEEMGRLKTASCFPVLQKTLLLLLLLLLQQEQQTQKRLTT